MGDGRAHDEEHLAPVAIDVGIEERAAVSVEGALAGPDELAEHFGHRLTSPRGNEVIHPAEGDETDCDVAVFGLDPDVADVGAQSRRNEGRRIHDVGTGHEQRSARRDAWRAAQQEAGALRVTNTGRRQRGGRTRRQEDLARIRGGLHRATLRGPRARHDQFAVRVAHQEEIEGPGVDAHRHAHLHGALRGSHAPKAAQGGAHAMRRRRGALGMGLTVEEQQQGVAAILQQ